MAPATSHVSVRTLRIAQLIPLPHDLLMDDFQSTNGYPGLFDEFIPKLSAYIKAINESLNSFKECYGLNCDHPDYLHLRTLLYSEATMYHGQIFPGTVKFIGDLKNLLGIYCHIDNPTDLLQVLQDQIYEIRKAQRDAEKLQIRHDFVYGNLMELETEIKRQQDQFSKQAKTDECKSTGAAIGGVGLAGVAAIVGTTSVPTATTWGLSAGVLGWEFGVEFLLIPAAPVVWPFVLAGTLMGAAAVGLAIAIKKADDASRINMAIVATQALFVALGGFSEIIQTASGMLEKMEEALCFMNMSRDRAAMQSYLDYVKVRIDTVLNLCGEFIECRTEFEEKMSALRQDVPSDFELRWQRKLQLKESPPSTPLTLDHSFI